MGIRRSRRVKQVEYPWGSNPPTAEHANYNESKVEKPVRSGLYPPNGYGLYDMAGNVWEFTADTWRDSHASLATEDPALRKVIKGGSFGADPIQLQVAFRDSHKPGDPVAHVGFRCAR